MASPYLRNNRQACEDATFREGASKRREEELIRREEEGRRRAEEERRQLMDDNNRREDETRAFSKKREADGIAQAPSPLA